MTEIKKTIEEILQKFESVKNAIRREDEHWYERWKAGGFQIDDTFFSNYPNLQEYLERDECDEDDEDDDDEGTGEVDW